MPEKHEFNWYTFLRDQNISEEKKAEKLADFISRFFNLCGDSERIKNLTVALMNTHRTLQQGFMRFIIFYLNEYAKLEYFDDRNKAAVNLAKKIAKFMEEDSDGCYLPLI